MVMDEIKNLHQGLLKGENKKPRLHKKMTWKDILYENMNMFLIIDCIIIVLLILGISLFVVFFHTCFVESGVMRNFLIGGV